jgi:hypothetical protein
MANRTNSAEPNRTEHYPCSVRVRQVRLLSDSVIKPRDQHFAYRPLRGRDVKIKLYWASVNIEAVQGHIFKHLYVVLCVPRLLLSFLTPFNVFPIRKGSFRTSRTMPLFGTVSNRTNSNRLCSGSHPWLKLNYEAKCLLFYNGLKSIIKDALALVGEEEKFKPLTSARDNSIALKRRRKYLHLPRLPNHPPDLLAARKYGSQLGPAAQEVH